MPGMTSGEMRATLTTDYSTAYQWFSTGSCLLCGFSQLRRRVAGASFDHGLFGRSRRAGRAATGSTGAQASIGRGAARDPCCVLSPPSTNASDVDDCGDEVPLLRHRANTILPTKASATETQVTAQCRMRNSNRCRLHTGPGPAASHRPSSAANSSVAQPSRSPQPPPHSRR